jgi:zinc protease
MPEPRRGPRVFNFPIHEKTLANGLMVVVVPFDSPGLAAHWVVVRVGSRDEIEPGHSGFAHFFEHMMFRGTERFSPERYNSILEGMGADANAFTSDDFTAYHILSAAEFLPRVMELESDRFMNLRYGADAFKKEARAVLGEYNKNFTFPESLIEEKLYEAAFSVHTYRHTTMGFLRDIEDMPNQYDYSRTFYDRYYRPEHSILLLVGDLDPEECFALAERYYGPWQRGCHRSRIPPEPPQLAEKTIRLGWDNPTLPYLTLGYHAPAFSTRDKEMPALDLISQVAFSPTSPLFRRLVIEEQMVDALSGGAADHRDPNLFIIGARVKIEEEVAAVRQAVEATLEDLKSVPVETARLEEIKSHMKYAFQMRLESAGAVAGALSHILQLTGDPGAYEELYATYDALTPADLLETARRIFRRENRTCVVLSFNPGRPGGGKE